MEISFINGLKIRYMFLENTDEDYKYKVIYYWFDVVNNVRKMHKKRISFGKYTYRPHYKDRVLGLYTYLDTEDDKEYHKSWIYTLTKNNNHLDPLNWQYWDYNFLY